MNPIVSQVYPSDKRAYAQIDALLAQEGIQRDANLDYTCAIYDEDYKIIATGSLFGNTLRCMAVSHSHQGEGLMNLIFSHLTEVQYARGNYHLFLYTKIESAKFFADLGFHEIARVANTLVFMENRKHGFADYLANLAQSKLEEGRSSALIVNANPFTLGHQYLVETAAKACDRLHLFIVSEDASLVPFAVRKKLVLAGTAHLPNVVCHETGSYMISNATFPSYFLKDEEAVIRGHAKLDIAIFSQIANLLGISCRYVGEEPHSLVTGIYNQTMLEDLPKVGVECRVIPRKEWDGKPISASTVRLCLQKGDLESLAHLVPKTTLDFFLSPEGEAVIRKIAQSSDVVHY